VAKGLQGLGKIQLTATEEIEVMADAFADRLSENWRTGSCLLELKGSMDAASQNELIDAINNAIRQAERGLIVSLEGVDFMDSSGIGALMRAWGDAENNGLKFAVVLRQPRLRKLLDTLGLLDTLPNFLTVSDALTEWRIQEEREKVGGSTTNARAESLRARSDSATSVDNGCPLEDGIATRLRTRVDSGGEVGLCDLRISIGLWA
jgi:anti-anti-sigma factor